MLSSLFRRRGCALCGKKVERPTRYCNDDGRKIVVCHHCVHYAERRAFRRR